MNTVAIITEYNPFHNGHKYQIERLRASFDEPITIIAIMSGSYTQRGEMAIANKLIRATSAVECGVDLVLELPFPFSMSSAEIFASSGVHIAASLGVVTHLAFGSECGDISALERIAENMLKTEFSELLSVRISDKKYDSVGFPALCESVYRELYKESLPTDIFSPNNILAIEYIKALKRINSSIKPMTIKREGAGYNDSVSADTSFQSATAIRNLLSECDNSALDYVPENAKSIYNAAINNQLMPTDQSLLDASVIAKFRLSSHKSCEEIHDAAGGLYNRLCEMSAEATSISSLTSMTETKRYTNARIRRAIWYSYFGVTSSEIKAYPSYTQLLATNECGRSLLKRIKKTTDFPIITKPADYKHYSDDVVRQFERALSADSIFALAHKSALSGNFSLKLTPYVKK